jgi:hypothetical protein
MSNAKAIVAAGQAKGLPPRAWVIAIATSLQESQLKNIGDLGAANDHDSLGLFQQRPSSGWGTPSRSRTRSTRPPPSTTASSTCRLAEPAADPGRAEGPGLGLPRPLRQARAQAGAMVSALYGVGPYAEIGKTV